jgi:hypothetical protein
MRVDRGATKFPGQIIPAIRFVITDRESYRPVRTSLVLIDTIRRHHPKDFTWGKSIDRLTGSDKVRRAIDGGTLPALLAQWDREAAAFRERRKPSLFRYACSAAQIAINAPSPSAASFSARRGHLRGGRGARTGGAATRSGRS